MRLPSVPTLPVVEHLNSAYFNSVWNASDDHGRANFPLQKAARRVQIGAVPVNLSVVGLPTTDKVYAVYQISPHVLGRFVSLPTQTWITDTDILQRSLVAISTYAASGRLIPAGQVHLRLNPTNTMVLIAIEVVYTSKCIGTTFPDLYMTVNYDTSRETPVHHQVLTVTAATTGPTSAAEVEQVIRQLNTDYPGGNYIYVNGWYYDLDDLPPLVSGSIVYLISDPDTLGYCDIPVDDNLTGYYSELYQEYREILHIPKIVNPNNYVITNDLIDVIVYDNVTKKGVYGHRVDQHAVESITHNDFSMSRSVLQAFQNELSSQGVTVRVYIRRPTRPLPLGREVNQITDLYSLPDAEIIRQLTNLSSKQIAEWKASHLEKSTYLDLLYTFRGFSSSDLLPKYVEAMGYYDVASVLSESIHTYTYKNGEVQINKPTRLIGYPVETIVYANGRKIPSTAVAQTQNTNHTFTLGFKSTAFVTYGAKITVYITEGGTRDVRSFRPVEDADTIILDNDDYDLVEIVTYDTPQVAWKETLTKGYKVLQRGTGNYAVTLNSNGTATYKINIVHYGKDFYLIPICALSTSTYPLDALLFNREPIILPLHMLDDDNNIIPLLSTKACELYLNGYRLSEGLDYALEPVLGTHNDIVQMLLEVSNSEYLNLSANGNNLEVVVHGDTVASHDAGYVISNQMYRSVPPMIWSKHCGRVFAKGRLITDVTEHGTTLISNTPLTDGVPYLSEWSMPYSVIKLMGSISATSDSNLRTRITGVLGLVPPVYPELVVLDDLYSLYSPYLAQIVNDVAAGTLVLVDEIQDVQFLRQFAPYALLLGRDAVLESNNPIVDRKFVSLAAHYANLSVQNPQQMLLVQRLITLLLTPGELSIEEVLI